MQHNPRFDSHLSWIPALIYMRHWIGPKLLPCCRKSSTTAQLGMPKLWTLKHGRQALCRTMLKCINKSTYVVDQLAQCQHQLSTAAPQQQLHNLHHVTRWNQTDHTMMDNWLGKVFLSQCDLTKCYCTRDQSVEEQHALPIIFQPIDTQNQFI